MRFRFSDFELDDDRVELSRDGEPVAVEPKALQLLQVLLRRHPATVSKHELDAILWPVVHVGEDALRRTVRVARRALGEGAGGPILRTVRGFGYRIAAPVERVSDAARTDGEGLPAAHRSFVGREELLGEVHRILASVDAGLGRVVLLAGEPGAGKTRTAEEVCERAARDGFEVMWGRCPEAGDAPPLWPWTQLLRSAVRARGVAGTIELLGSGAGYLTTLVPDLGQRVDRRAPLDPTDPGAARYELFDAVVRLLERSAARRPIVVTIDDLHMADPTSVALFEHAARALRGSRVLLLATYRDVAAPPNPALDRALAGLERSSEGNVVLRLGPLEEQDVRALLALRVETSPSEDLVARVMEASGGNPYFATELAAWLRGGGREGSAVPASVRTVLSDRVDGLSEDVQDVLSAASVIGRNGELALLARTLSRPEIDVLESLEACERAGLLHVDGDEATTFQFRHALGQETVYALLSRSRRARLHRAAGEAIEQRSGGELEPELAALAHHFGEAFVTGTAEKAIGYALRAAASARARLSYESAARHLQRAVDLVERSRPVDAKRLCEVLLELGEMEGWAGNREGSIAAASRAARLARLLDSPELFTRAALLRSAGGPRFGRVDEEAVALLEEALSGEAPGGPDATSRVLLLRDLAGHLAFSDPDRRVPLLAEARHLARELGDERLLFQLGSEERGLRHWLALANERLDRARSFGPREHFAALLNRGTVRLYGGDVAGMRADYGAAEALAGRVRGWRARYWPALGRAGLAILEGRLDEARQGMEATRRIADGAYHDALVQYSAQAYVMAYHRGTLRFVEDQVRDAETSFDPLARAFLARTCAAVRRRDEARRLFEGFAECRFENVLTHPVFVNEHWEYAWPTTMSMLAEVCVYLGDEPRAAILYEQMSDAADFHAVLGDYVSCHVGPIALRLGMLATCLGRFDAAQQHLDATIAWADREGARTWLAHALVARGGLYAACGGAERGERSRTDARRVLELAREIGMQGVMREAYELLE